MKERGMLKDIRVIALLFFIIASLFFIYVYPLPPAGTGINGNLRYGLDLVGGTWLQLKLEGTLAKIDAPLNINESAVISFLEDELDTEVFLVHSDAAEGGVYEIRKSVSKEVLSEKLKKINATIGKKANGEDFFEDAVTPATRDETRRIIETKLNMLGLAGTIIRTVGNNIILIDFPGVGVQEAKDIVGKPGKFEIRIQTEGKGGDIEKGQRLEEISNITAHVMYGGEGIQSVGIVPSRENERLPWGAPFTLNKDGAVALRDVAIKYSAIDNPTDHELAMLLDDVVIYSAQIAKEACVELKNKNIYSWIANTGTGDEGFKSAKELIIHLRAGALPVKVKIIGSEVVPAYLGEKFKEGALIAGLLALLSVTFVSYLRYRNKKIVMPMFFILLSEVIIILGFAAVIKWRLDLPSIAGIIVVIGTGVDQLVIITDEFLSGGSSSTKMQRKRISFAYGIIFVSVTTTIVAMLTLAFLAMGTLRGFAIVTIFGLLVGLIITRPAYARIIEKL